MHERTLLGVVIVLLLVAASSPDATATSHEGWGAITVSGQVLCAGINVPEPDSAVLGRAIRKVTPAYPQKARAARVTGTVVILVSLSSAGIVEDSQVVSGGNQHLELAALFAAQDWRFSPTTVGGKPVAAIAEITFKFSES
jgi:TonB family protein